MLPVLSAFLSEQQVCVKSLWKMLFFPSLFQFFGFVCLLLFSCALSHSLINVDFLFHLLLRGPFSLKFHFFFVYFLHPSNSLFNLLSLLPCTCLGQLLLFSVLFPISQPAEKKTPKSQNDTQPIKIPNPGHPTDQVLEALDEVGMAARV